MRTRRTSTRNERVNDLGDLLVAMEREDEELEGPAPATDGNPSSEAGNRHNDVDEEDDDGEDEDDFESHAKKVMNDYIHADTRYAYRLNQRRFIKHLYILSQTDDKPGRDARALLHPNLLRSLDALRIKSSMAVEAVAMEHLDQASAEYLPLKLDLLDPEIFVKYLLTISDTRNGEYLKSYGGHRSALMSLFTQCEVSATAEFKEKLKKVMKGLKNSAASARGRIGANLREGKEPMPFSLYCALCKWLLEEGTSEGIFAHCFLTVTWNLMCRSRNTVFAMREHISWISDAMQIQFAHTKRDREGKDGGWKRSIFANPFMPEICCPTSVARFLALNPGGAKGPLFSGSAQYDRFRRILNRVVTAHSEDVRRFGVDPRDIGVHSIRKGAATYACNGTTSGASFASVCFRAGWSMGGTKDRYLQWEAAGDQVVGRIVAGLDVTSYKFLVSPPHFRLSDNHSQDTDEGVRTTPAQVDKTIDDVFGLIPDNWRLLCWYLLACLLFNRKSTRELCQHNSRLQGSRLMQSGNYDEVEASTRIIYPGDVSNETGDSLWRIVFTGMTPMAVCFLLHQKTLEVAEQIPMRVSQIVVDELNKRELGVGGLTIESLRGELMVPFNEVMKKLETMTSKLPESSGITKAQKPSALDRLGIMPSNYELNPALSCLDVWLSWHFGSDMVQKDGKVVGRTQPWKTLKPSQLKGTAMERKKFFAMKFLCKEFDQAASGEKMEKNNLPKFFNSPSVRAVLEPLAVTQKGRKRRLDQLHWVSVAAQLRACRKSQKAKIKHEAPDNISAVPEKLRMGQTAKTQREKKPSAISNMFREVITVKDDDDCPVIPSSAVKTSKKATKNLLVDGPDPDCPVMGRLQLEYDKDMWPLMQQGRMVTGFTTSCYFNILTRLHYHLGVRCSGDEFLGAYGNIVQQNTGDRDAVFNRFLQGHARFGRVAGTELRVKRLKEDWRYAPVLLLQIFEGMYTAGHFSLLIVDRTVHAPGIFIYIDSFRVLFPGTFEKVKKLVGNSPISKKGARWIEGTITQQGPSTNDCGIFMCMFASAYVLHLQESGLLIPQLPFERHRPQKTDSIPSRFEATINKDAHLDAQRFGVEGRKHIMKCLQTNEFHEDFWKDKPINIKLS